MKKKPNTKAEDILTEENFSISALQEPGEDIGTENDIQVASEIHSFLTSDKSTFPEMEKEQTKNRIKTSVRNLKFKKQLLRLSAAAAVLLICVSTGIWYFQIDSNSDITTFARTLKESIPDQETRLILQNGQEVKVGKEESQISYAQNGTEITIGKDQKVVQEITNQKTSYNTVIVPYGRRTFVTLSEGTKVWLNSGSKLIYPVVFAENKREVYIDGEAVFEVTHSEVKPFYVKTRDFNIKVLGTIFNVCSYSDDTSSSTVLKQGKIELSYNGNLILPNKKITILPGTRAVFDPDKNKFTSSQVNPLDYMSWHNGYLVFNKEKLGNILKRLTRYYNVEILLQNIGLQNEIFSGNLDLKNSADEVLNTIAQTTPFKFEHRDNKLFIIPNN